MNNDLIFKKIEELYFDNKFNEVIEYWGKNKLYYTFENNKENDHNILEALAASYDELGMYDNCLKYRNLQIQLLKYMELPKSEKEKKYRYYYSNVANIYSDQNKKIAEYKVVLAYLQIYPNDEIFIKSSDYLEEYFYRKYLTFIKYFLYFNIVLVVVFILRHITNISISKNIYNIYNFFSVISIVWLLLNYAFPKIFRKYFLITLRYFLLLQINHKSYK